MALKYRGVFKEDFIDSVILAEISCDGNNNLLLFHGY